MHLMHQWSVIEPDTTSWPYGRHSRKVCVNSSCYSERIRRLDRHGEPAGPWVRRRRADCNHGPHNLPIPNCERCRHLCRPPRWSDDQ